MMLSLARRSVFTAVRRAAPMSTATSISQASDLNKRLEESDPVLFDIIENEKVRVASVVIRTGVLVQTVEYGSVAGCLSGASTFCIRTIGVPRSNM